MIDSLFDLIAALFIASLPILLLIMRSRRRRASQGEHGEASPTSEGASPGKRRRKLGQALFRRFARAEEEEEPAPERQTEEPRRREPYRREESVFERLAPEERQREPEGKDRLLDRVDRYPPLQRAVVLKELLGPPKGLQ